MSTDPLTQYDELRGINVTPSTFANASPTNIILLDHYSDYVRMHEPERFRENEEETEKQKIQRIARKKMHASWKSYNQIAPKVIKLKYVCKPHHRIRNLC